MKRIFLLLVLSLFLSGCSIEYNAYIDEGIVYENSYFVDIDNIENDNIFENMATRGQVSFFDANTATSEHYEVRKFDPGEDLLGLNYYYEFNYSDFVNSSFFSECFSQRIFSYNNDVIVLSTNTGIDCMYRDDTKNFDELVINISSPYKLVETNADKIEDDIYTWVINDSNFLEKSILLKLDSTISNQEISENLFNDIITYIAIVLLGIVFIFLITFYIKYKRSM